ncbi:MAG: hypothetical protein PHN18_00270 [Sulfurospirillaceae bacterium]|nr:hypothetical protein [Sulfurospirillaceae bacterium]MDD2826227.1 hypothetical protein [Sulfurospirillaceae bacterium]
MLLHYLQNAVKDIDNLIDLTKKDIEDIKVANHNEIFGRIQIKNDLIQSFETKKSLLDNELVKILKESHETSLELLLNAEQKELLSLMKLKLSELKIINKEYAKFVVTISQFYNSLLDKIFPRDMEGYKMANHKPASFLKIRA